MKRPAPLPIAFALVALTGCARSLPADEETAACQALQGRALGAGVIKRAEAVAPGQKLSLAGAKAEPSVPFGFCRIEVTLSAEPGSEIQSAYWLPVKTAWNGKFFGIGNGGFGGVIMESQMFPALRNGYAVGATDLGHPASFPKTLAPMNAKWAYKQPAKLIDWAHRANHLTAEAGKEVLIAYFGQKPKRAYFHGCSDGGREALMEAGRYPQDYDGIIAGAPAAAFTDLLTQAQWNSGQAEPTNLTEEKLRRLHEAVLDRCDALDGAKDGLIENPGACRFDPEVLQCKAGDDGKRCLAKVEVEAVRAIYQGPRTRDGQQMRGFSYGSEYVTGWSLWITGPELPMVGTVKRMTGGSMLSTDFFRWMVHADPDWGREKFDFDKDLAAARQKLATTINSHELDLSPFFSRGRTPGSPRPTSSPAAATSCCSITAGPMPPCRPRTPLTTTRSCATAMATPPHSRVAFSWRRAWGTAWAGQAPAFSTRSGPSTAGWKAARRPSSFWPRSTRRTRPAC